MERTTRQAVSQTGFQSISQSAIHCTSIGSRFSSFSIGFPSFSSRLVLVAVVQREVKCGFTCSAKHNVFGTHCHAKTSPCLYQLLGIKPHCECPLTGKLWVNASRKCPDTHIYPLLLTIDNGMIWTASSLNCSQRAINRPASLAPINFKPTPNACSCSIAVKKRGWSLQASAYFSAL